MEQLTWQCAQTIPAVYKSFWQGNKLEIVATVALSIVAIAIPIFFLSNLENSRDSFLLNRADPNRVMATDIKSFHDIANLKEINGVLISKIEARARPGAWSDSGFIGKNDNLQEVLQRDWKTVYDLGTTHIELANHLQSIWNSATEVKGERVINYDFSKMVNNTLNNKSSIQPLIVKISSYMGWQNDIFCNNTIFDKKMVIVGKTDHFWNEDLQLINKENGEKILLAHGVINYIRKYGFYESGETNEYRIDPIRLAAVLSGHKYCSIAKSIGQSRN